MNVKGILWLFILVCDVVNSDSMNLLYISLLLQRNEKNSWGQLN